ncbi:MAG: hypothetical protein K0S10_2555 [Rubrobacteraceae bacterium]|jgi:hypothetical protein|nr:hypothetical protein [Rubrobacteraceae bacterium]
MRPISARTAGAFMNVDTSPRKGFSYKRRPLRLALLDRVVSLYQTVAEDLGVQAAPVCQGGGRLSIPVTRTTCLHGSQSSTPRGVAPPARNPTR